MVRGIWLVAGWVGLGGGCCFGGFFFVWLGGVGQLPEGTVALRCNSSRRLPLRDFRFNPLLQVGRFSTYGCINYYTTIGL